MTTCLPRPGDKLATALSFPRDVAFQGLSVLQRDFQVSVLAVPDKEFIRSKDSS